jgi:hypothetical protein
VEKYGAMIEREITFHNKLKIKVQAQIFIGRTYISTCVADPGEVCVLPGQSVHYDVFLKNGATGWEIARKLDIAAKTLILSQTKGRYVLSIT